MSRDEEPTRPDTKLSRLVSDACAPFFDKMERKLVGRFDELQVGIVRAVIAALGPWRHGVDSTLEVHRKEINQLRMDSDDHESRILHLERVIRERASTEPPGSPESG